jgi:hypothetical protein
MGELGAQPVADDRPVAMFLQVDLGGIPGDEGRPAERGALGDALNGGGREALLGCQLLRRLTQRPAGAPDTRSLAGIGAA